MGDFDDHLDNYGDPGAGTSNGPEPEPFYADDSVTLYLGDTRQVMEALPDQSVDCIVTSPPYFGLRDYGVEGQHGSESSPAEFVETMRATFAEARRVLADDGTLWLNLGDSYSSTPPGKTEHADRSTTLSSGRHSPATKAMRESVRRAGVDRTKFLPEKNMMGMPWRVAFALQDDGWILRNDVIWAKPNAMPESVTDRLSNRHEHLFMFSKSRRYWFDLCPIREPSEAFPTPRDGPNELWNRGTGLAPHNGHRGSHEQGRNPGDVWTIPTAPFPGAHFATFPIELPRRCIKAGCKPGGTVLDPYSGSGTTGLAAGQLGRRYVGIDLNAEYLDLSLRTRLVQGTLGID